MTAIAAQAKQGRLFLTPTNEHIQGAMSAAPNWQPYGRLPDQAMNLRIQGYGITHWHQLFTKRQLTTLTYLQ